MRQTTITTRQTTIMIRQYSLAVIVTDLFQDEGDINRLVAQLKEKYLQKELAVGLLGIRSQFDGTVYDAGINVPPIDHQGDRPFYLLVLGRHADIAYYFDQIKAEFDESKTVPLFPISGQFFGRP